MADDIVEPDAACACAVQTPRSSDMARYQDELPQQTGHNSVLFSGEKALKIGDQMT